MKISQDIKELIKLTQDVINKSYAVMQAAIVIGDKASIKECANKIEINATILKRVVLKIIDEQN